MATKKTTKKSTKPTLVIDATECVTAEDVVIAFAVAKIKKYLTEAERTTLCDRVLDCIADCAAENIVSLFGNYNTIHFDGESIIRMNLRKYDIDDDEKFVCDAKGNTSIEKPNIFKRFWNWITRKK